MARVTVEDCVEKTETRFELVLAASQRARKIGTGAALTIDRDNDKNTVVALREIAAETVTIDDLKEELTKAHQRMVAAEDDDDDIEFMDGEEEWEKMAQAAAQGDDAPAAGGLYADEEVSADAGSAATDGEPGLADIAGSSASDTPAA